MIPFIVSLVTGAAGGLLAGYLIKRISLGDIPNAICGIVGGGLGGTVLGVLGVTAGPSGSLGAAAVLGSILSGLVGGGIVLAVVGFVLSATRKAT